MNAHRASSASSPFCPAEPHAQAAVACRLIAAVAMLLMGVAAVCGVARAQASLARPVAAFSPAQANEDSGLADEAPIAPGHDDDERECSGERDRPRSQSPSRIENISGRKNLSRFVPTGPGAGPAQHYAGGGDAMGLRLSCVGTCAIVHEREPALRLVGGQVTTRGPPMTTNHSRC